MAYILTDDDVILEVEGIQARIIDYNGLNTISSKDGVDECNIPYTQFHFNSQMLSQNEVADWFHARSVNVNIRNTAQWRDDGQGGATSHFILYHAGLGDFTPYPSRGSLATLRSGDEIVVLQWWYDSQGNLQTNWRKITNPRIVK